MKDAQTKKTTENNTAEDEKKTRRDFLKYAGLGAGGMALIRCVNEILETSPSSQVSRSTNALTDLTYSWGSYGGDMYKPCLLTTWFCSLHRFRLRDEYHISSTVKMI